MRFQEFSVLKSQVRPLTISKKSEPFTFSQLCVIMLFVPYILIFINTLYVTINMLICVQEIMILLKMIELSFFKKWILEMQKLSSDYFRQ